jgi:hypothetical protein
MESGAAEAKTRSCQRETLTGRWKPMSRNRVLSALAAAGLAATAATALAAPASAGVSGPAFYVDHQLYRTVATPTDLSSTGAPDSTFDVLYAFADQRAVADAAPGTPGYNGGRWQVHAVAVDDYEGLLAAADLDGNGVIDAVDEVHAGFASGLATDTGVVREFVCTVNPLPRNGR